MNSSTGPQRREPPPDPAALYLDYGPGLPDRHGRPVLGALVVGPRRIFTYWESPGPIPGRRHGLRLRGGGEQFFDVADAEAGTWYFGAEPDTPYEVDFGWMEGGEFRPLLETRRVRTPRETPATAVDPEWAPTEGEREVWQRLSGTAAPRDLFRPGYGGGGASHA